jgi:transcriptional regulator with XRE-family HTH domain
MHVDTPALGDTIRELRCALGWSQGRLAAELCEASGRPTVTREDVSRWEHGRRVPGPFWVRHLAAVLQVPQRVLEGCVRRREMLRLAGAIAGSAAVGTPSYAAGEELYSSIAAGDDAPLARVQTSHETDLMLAGLAGGDRPVMLRLARWADDGGSDVLRVNAAGILAKTRSLDSAGLAAAALQRDREIRLRYLRAVSARVGTGTRRLAVELGNPADAGARWCSAWLLGQDGTPAARLALAGALRTEPVTENLRTIGMILNGDDPCS